MKSRLRFALLLAFVPVAFYAYACSSDDSSGGTTPGGDDDSGSNPDTGGNPGTDSGQDTGTDSGTDSGDAGTDGAVGPQCVGNPLTADGGIADGGDTLDAAVAHKIFTEVGFGEPFLDGPQYIDLNGGSIVFSELSDNPPSMATIKASDGSSRTLFRASSSAGSYLVGSAIGDGGIYTTVSPQDNTGATIFVTHTDGGIGTSLPITDLAAKPSPNDLAIGPKGDIYFTDPQYQETTGGTTGVYRRLGDGGFQTIDSTNGQYNGIVLSPDNGKLYVSTTDAKNIHSFVVNADGSVGTTATLVAGTIDAPDGLAVDIGGNLWVAEAAADGTTATGRVEIFTPAGKKLGEIPFPSERPTGLAFGGTDNKTLFVTTEGLNTTTHTAGVWVFSSRCAGIR